jgi:hypothetical protein
MIFLSEGDLPLELCWRCCTTRLTDFVGKNTQTKAPQTPFRVAGRSSNSPPPKSAPKQPNVLICTVSRKISGVYTRNAMPDGAFAAIRTTVCAVNTTQSTALSGVHAKGIRVLQFLQFFRLWTNLNQGLENC